MTAEAAPSRPFAALWRTLVRWESGKIIPPVAIRNTIGFALALVIATLADSTNAGVLAGLGALNVSYSDGLDPYSVRARRMGFASLLCGAAVTAGALSGHTNFTAVVTATIGAFAAGMLIALGTRAGDLGVVTLVTLVIFAARPLPVREAIESGLVALGGGLLQTLLSIALWPVKPYQPERTIIAELYGAIARIADEESGPSSAPPVSRQISDAQEALASLADDHSVEAERHVFLLNQAERIRLALINLSQMRRRMSHEPKSREAADALADVLKAAADAAIDIGDCAIRGVPVRTLDRFQAAADRFRDVASAGAF
ncbi:MAG TPA: FUSC family membrane protein, partial [Bryobacteraceae bacterium]|nr:FUSC family membrane protein [Bryobacteraceae bacterium]